MTIEKVEELKTKPSKIKALQEVHNGHVMKIGDLKEQIREVEELKIQNLKLLQPLIQPDLDKAKAKKEELAKRKAEIMQEEKQVNDTLLNLGISLKITKNGNGNRKVGETKGRVVEFCTNHPYVKSPTEVARALNIASTGHVSQIMYKEGFRTKEDGI